MNQYEIIGYTVRYARDDANFGRPLHFGTHGGANEPALWIHTEGTIFTSMEAALNAIIQSLKYQLKTGRKWTLMYGGHVVTPVYDNNHLPATLPL